MDVLNCSLFLIYTGQSLSSRGSLILVDRTLDLVGAASHTFDTLADRIIQSLPRLPQHTSDVAVDMSPLCSPGRYDKGHIFMKGDLFFINLVQLLTF